MNKGVNLKRRLQNKEKAPTKMTFFSRFEADILSGNKTITIRDISESDYVVGTRVEVATLEEGRVFTYLKIMDVTEVCFHDLTDFHAQQENMSLVELKQVISDIYPGISQLFVISFALISE